MTEQSEVQRTLLVITQPSSVRNQQQQHAPQGCALSHMLYLPFDSIKDSNVDILISHSLHEITFARKDVELNIFGYWQFAY